MLHVRGGSATNLVPQTPPTEGYRWAGGMREAGLEVTDGAPGPRVAALMPNGSQASLGSVPAASTWPVPEALDIKQAAAVPVPWGTADDCLFEFGHLKAGETVLIQAGAGGVGLAAIQLAKRAGATVLATASSDAKLERLKDFGLDHGLNYRDADFAAAFRELTNGRGVHLSVHVAGGRPL